MGDTEQTLDYTLVASPKMLIGGRENQEISSFSNMLVAPPDLIWEWTDIPKMLEIPWGQRLSLYMLVCPMSYTMDCIYKVLNKYFLNRAEWDKCSMLSEQRRLW